MISFTAPIQKFDAQGEKTGWTYVLIPAETAAAIKPNTRKSFRVKGMLDKQPVSSIALMPMGGGDFILVLNADLRKKIRKKCGETLALSLEEDAAPLPLPEDLLLCLKEEPEAKSYFFSLAPSHRFYFGKWIDSAKTEATRTKRIIQTMAALRHRRSYSEMIREGSSLL